VQYFFTVLVTYLFIIDPKSPWMGHSQKMTYAESETDVRRTLETV